MADYASLGVRKLRKLVPGGHRMTGKELVAYLTARDYEATQARAAEIVPQIEAMIAPAPEPVVTVEPDGVVQVDVFATPTGRGGPGKARPVKVRFYRTGDPEPHVGNFTSREVAEATFTQAVAKGTHETWEFVTAS